MWRHSKPQNYVHRHYIIKLNFICEITMKRDKIRFIKYTKYLEWCILHIAYFIELIMISFISTNSLQTETQLAQNWCAILPAQESLICKTNIRTDRLTSIEITMESSLYVGNQRFHRFRGWSYPRIYTPKNVQQSNELSYIVMQQTSYSRNNVLTNQHYFENPWRLAPTNKDWFHSISPNTTNL